MKVAIIHYWWLSNRGGEAVISALIDIFPNADIFLHVSDDELVLETLGPNFTGKLFNTFISKLPFSKKYYQKYLPFMPFALEQLDLSNYDLVISSESGPAKGVITSPNSVHICYCHSPMRYIWDLHHEYLRSSGRFIKIFFPIISHWLRLWDINSAYRVDYFLANSSFVSKRIRKYYRRESELVYPPVEVSSFSFSEKRENFYLCLGQLVSYKKIDLAIQSFNLLGLPLIIIGEGDQLNNLKKMANSNIHFLGRQSFNVVQRHLETCKALIFPGVEDFGIVCVEAMAAGAPVIAYGKGGVLDTVIDGETGILFKSQDPHSLAEAVMKIEDNQICFNTHNLHSHALNFEKNKFRTSFLEFINKIGVNVN